MFTTAAGTETLLSRTGVQRTSTSSVRRQLRMPTPAQVVLQAEALPPAPAAAAAAASSVITDEASATDFTSEVDSQSEQADALPALLEHAEAIFAAAMVQVHQVAEALDVVERFALGV
jgi:hypothetical protein